jgi:hypothetical protein
MVSSMGSIAALATTAIHRYVIAEAVGSNNLSARMMRGVADLHIGGMAGGISGVGARPSHASGHI